LPPDADYFRRFRQIRRSLRFHFATPLLCASELLLCAFAVSLRFFSPRHAVLRHALHFDSCRLSNISPPLYFASDTILIAIDYIDIEPAITPPLRWPMPPERRHAIVIFIIDGCQLADIFSAIAIFISIDSFHCDISFRRRCQLLSLFAAFQRQIASAG